MISDLVKCLTDSIDKYFPVNIFLITNRGKIRWANLRMIKDSGFNYLEEIENKHVSLFGEEEWNKSKEVIKSKKSIVYCCECKDKYFLTIKSPYKEASSLFRGLIGLSIDISMLQGSEKNKKSFINSTIKDINEPMTNIITMSTLQYMGLIPENKYVENSKFILESSTKLMESINKIPNSLFI